jgi:hypothetical protein
MTMHLRWLYLARPRPRRALGATLALAATLAAGGCGGGDPATEEGKSPFATGNVSVAPQVEGRAPVPTPVPPPLPTQQTPTAPAP